MNIEQALQIIEQVCASHRGTRQDHVMIQQALETIKAAVTKKEE